MVTPAHLSDNPRDGILILRKFCAPEQSTVPTNPDNAVGIDGFSHLTPRRISASARPPDRPNQFKV